MKIRKVASKKPEQGRESKLGCPWLSMFFIIFLLPIPMLSVVYGSFASASTILHKFKNPSFSGEGTSAHYLTVDQQENTRRQDLAEKIQSELDDLQRELDNSTLSKFLKNLESRIYSQLSRDIADSLFNAETGGTGGTIELEGSTITFLNDGENITITVVAEDGAVTEIIIPIGVFGICSEDCGI